TIRMYDMPTMRIRRYWPGESRLGRLAMDLASSVSVPLSAVPPEISRLVLESLMPPAPSRRSTVGRRSVDESLLVPLRAFSVYGGQRGARGTVTSMIVEHKREKDEHKGRPDGVHGQVGDLPLLQVSKRAA